MLEHTSLQHSTRRSKKLRQEEKQCLAMMILELMLTKMVKKSKTEKRSLSQWPSKTRRRRIRTKTKSKLKRRPMTNLKRPKRSSLQIILVKRKTIINKYLIIKRKERKSKR